MTSRAVRDVRERLYNAAHFLPFMPIVTPDNTSRRRMISIVCAVYNEEPSIDYFYERLARTLAPLRDRYDFELIFVNNASQDGTLGRILALRRVDPSVQVLTQSRNFGYQASFLCGMQHVHGDATIIIDVDCEDPPEMIPTFIQRWEEGYDLVYGQRAGRPEAAPVVWARKLFYRITHAIADTDFVIDMAEFSLFSDRVRQEAIHSQSTFPFMRSQLAFVGFQRIGIPYDRQLRAFGKTYYNVLGMFAFAINGMLSASTFPLRFIAYAGFPAAAINLLAALAVAVGADIRWLAVLVMLDAALAFLAFGVLAVYLARVTKDVAARPVFIVDWERSHVNVPTGMAEASQRP